MNSPLNSNAMPHSGSAIGKSWDRSAARARGSALSRDYRSTASALGLPDPSKVIGNYNAPACETSFSYSKRATTPLTSVTKSDYRAPSYGSYNASCNGSFQPSVLNSYAARSEKTALNGQPTPTPTNAQYGSSLPRDDHSNPNMDPEHYSSKMALKNLDFANPIEPRQFSWPTPKSIPDGYAAPSTSERTPLSKEEFLRNLRTQQTKNHSMETVDCGLSVHTPDGLLNRQANQQIASHKNEMENYQESSGHTNYPINMNGNVQSSYRSHGADVNPENEFRTCPKNIEHWENKQMSMAEKPYESQPPIDSVSPGYTKAAVKSAAANAVNPVANYSVGSGYTDNKYAAGIVRPRYGAPSRNWPGLPESDPSYPQPEYKIPPPEAGLKKLSWKDERDETEITRLAPEAQARYPGDAYKPPDDNIATSQSAYGPASFEQLRSPEQIKASYPLKSDYDSQMRPPSAKVQTFEGQTQDVQHHPPVATELGIKNDAVSSESNALKGLKKIQTTNQTYGSWVDDPYLRGREWWYKPTRFPLNKTFLSKFKEDAGVWS